MAQATLTASERPSQPFYPDRVMNFLGRFKKPIIFEPTEQMEAASAATGLDDFGSEDFLPALKIFYKAFSKDRQMSYTGRASAKRFDTKLLIDRLQIQATLKKDPEIEQQEVRGPIMICGNPRSGTTLLQRLLAQDSQFRAMLAWEAYFGTTPPHPDTYNDNSSIHRTEEYLAIIDRTSPALLITHPMEVKLPEECWILMERQFIRPLFSLFWEIPEYWEWLLDRSEDHLTNDVLYYRKQLQILQRHFQGPRWVLKSPVHGLFLPPFSRVFPDMHFIQCHRDPVRVLPSMCSLLAARKAAYYGLVDLRALGRKGLEFADSYFDRVLKAREKLGGERFLDVSFSRLLEDPIDTIQDLYESLGLKLTGETEKKMEKFLESQREGKHTKHRYTLDEFGLDKATVSSHCERYRAQFQDFL